MYLDFIISPNPSTGTFTLRGSWTNAKQAKAVITDMRGKMILQLSLTASATQPEQVDMSGYPKGIYLVKIQTETESRVRKLVIN